MYQAAHFEMRTRKLKPWNFKVKPLLRLPVPAGTMRVEANFAFSFESGVEIIWDNTCLLKSPSLKSSVYRLLARVAFCAFVVFLFKGVFSA